MSDWCIKLYSAILRLPVGVKTKKFGGISSAGMKSQRMGVTATVLDRAFYRWWYIVCAYQEHFKGKGLDIAT